MVVQHYLWPRPALRAGLREDELVRGASAATNEYDSNSLTRRENKQMLAELRTLQKVVSEIRGDTADKG